MSKEIKMRKSFEVFEPMQEYRKLSSKQYPQARHYKIRALSVCFSGNRHKYTREELRLAGRSLSDRPINVNHANPLKFPDSSVLDSEYNEAQCCIEAILRIDDARVNRLFSEGKIHHCSIEGHARSATEINGVAPCGVVLTALSLVTNDREPGDPSTSIELFAEPSEEISLKELGEFNESDRRFEEVRKEIAAEIAESQKEASKP